MIGPTSVSYLPMIIPVPGDAVSLLLLAGRELPGAGGREGKCLPNFMAAFQLRMGELMLRI